MSGNFCFYLLLGMVMYTNEVETKESLKLPEIKKLTTTYTLNGSLMDPSR